MAHVTTAMLCDSAAVYEGKLSILGGGVSTVNGPTFPLQVTLWFVARVDWTEEDLGRAHVVVLRCEHADGEQLARLDATFEALAPPDADPDLPSGLNVVVPLPLEFRRPGLYELSMTLDGERVVSLPLKPKTLLPNA